MANPHGLKRRTKRKKTGVIRPLIFVLLLMLVVAVQYFHPERYLDKEHLRQFAASYGALLPVLYLVIWTVGPLFFPASPLLWPAACSWAPSGGWSMCRWARLWAQGWFSWCPATWPGTG